MTATSLLPSAESLAASVASRTVRPAGVLRLEGAAVAAASLVLYAAGDASWGLFALLILAPDLGLLGYLAGPRFGAHAYNLTHNLVLPVVLGAVGVATAGTTATAVSLIWLTHIGVDRAVGYGLKYPDDFRRTHLQRLPA